MWRVERVTGYPYESLVYGLFKRQRRKTRVYFSAAKGSVPPVKVLEGLLPEVYRRMGGLRVAPTPMPERIRATWDQKHGGFTLSGFGLLGFYVDVKLRQQQDDAEQAAEEVEAKGAT